MPDVTLGGKSWIKPRVPAAHVMTLGHTLHAHPSPLGSPESDLQHLGAAGSPGTPSLSLSPHLAFFQDWPGPQSSLTHPPELRILCPGSCAPEQMNGVHTHPRALLTCRD